jgi:glycine cleavage system H protein
VADMSTKYVLPCAGYDRPGGKISRLVADHLLLEDSSINIGSIGALSSERPGELKDLRSSDVVCIDGCSVKCASKMVERYHARGFESIEVSTIPDFEKLSVDEKVTTIANMIFSLWETEPSKVEKMAEADRPEGDYFTEMIDKFILRVKKGLLYSDNDFWIQREDDLVRIGLSDLLQQMVSDVYFVELAEIGTKVEFGDELGSFESTKIAMEIISPISGTVIEKNNSLDDNPELVNEDPYEKGWLYVIRPDDSSELDLLKAADEYLTYGVEKAKHELGKKVSE